MGLFDWVKDTYMSASQAASEMLGTMTASPASSAPPPQPHPDGSRQPGMDAVPDGTQTPAGDPSARWSNVTSPRQGRSVFVRERQSNMYFDEDGDLAHEFYSEEADGSLARQTQHLRPQGVVPLEHPAISNSVRVVLCAEDDLPRIAMSVVRHGLNDGGASATSP